MKPWEPTAKLPTWLACIAVRSHSGRNYQKPIAREITFNHRVLRLAVSRVMRETAVQGDEFIPRCIKDNYVAGRLKLAPS